METDNLILEHLRGIRADIGAMARLQREHTLRLQALETGQAHHSSEIALIKTICDGLGDRLDRIERRLDIAL